VNAQPGPFVCSIVPVEAIVRLARDYPVFPCRRDAAEIVVGGKRKLIKPKSPLTPHGFEDASRDPDRIRAWWREHPEALVGVPTGTATNLIVIDYDEYKAEAPAKEWIAEHSDALLATRSHATLGGGRHYLFRVAGGIEYRGGVSLFLGGLVRAGLDVRASGGYIIWWPLHGASATGEIAFLPAGLIDERRIEVAELEPLPKATPASWRRDRIVLTEILPWIEPADYDRWMQAGMAISLASGGSDDGFALWHAWSAGELTGECPPSYAGIQDCRYRWASYRHGRPRDKTVTIGSLVHFATTAGWKKPERSQSLEAQDDEQDAQTPTETPPADPIDDPGPDGPVEIGLSDDELALRFSARYSDSLRYVAAWDRWLMWDGKRWAHDEKRKVFDLSRSICREVLEEHLAMPMTDTQRKTLRKRLGDARTVYNVTKLAGSDPRHAVAVSELDAHPWLLNTPGGVVDLRTGAISPHDPKQLHTKVTAASIGGDCLAFLRVLREAFPDEEGEPVRDYIQRLFGYGMTGSCRDHALSFWWGSGRNGKGTLAHAFRRALGDYGLEVGAELFMESHHERHPTEIAVLRGSRFVVASEIDTGRRWNEARLKRLTGGDPISARYIGKDLFEFEPTHTLLIIGNTKPGIRSVDEAMRSRLHLVEFCVTVPAENRDTTLPAQLEAEYGGILAWALVGCIAWQQKGLSPPKIVTSATDAYLEAEDSVAQWMAEKCQKSGSVTLAAAHRSYREWCEHNSGTALGRNAFADQLVSHGAVRKDDYRGKLEKFERLSLVITQQDSWGSTAYDDDMYSSRNTRNPREN